MDQREFLTRYWTLLDMDCRKSNVGHLSRTFTDKEAEIFAQHIWDLFQSGPAAAFDATWLTHALLKTRRKFDSEQDRAAAMLKMR